MDLDYNKIIENIPKTPGVYQMLDKDGALLYVGKAKNLLARVRQYSDISKLPYNTKMMRGQVRKIEIIQTATESDALVLESDIIKTKNPKYNILMTDDKMYPMLALSSDEYPRLYKFRAKISAKKDVFGPYTSVAALHESIKLIQKVCKLRTCTNSYMNNRTRPCILAQIGRCSAPCVNKEYGAYNENVKLARRILSGDTTAVVKDLSQQMDKSSSAQDYESAAEYRDKIRALSETASRGKFGSRDVSHIAKAQTEKFQKSFLEFQDWLGIQILHVDVFDNSHTGGKDPVGAVISFDKNGFVKSKYRHYKMDGHNDDISMMREIISRHTTSYLLPLTSYLIIVDGGKQQWNAATKSAPGVPVLAITKGDVRDGDESFIMPDGTKTRLPKDSPLHLFLRLIRDEAHRFAITFHKKQRIKHITKSALDDIDGIGAARKRALLRHFGSVALIADADAKTIARVSGISKSCAEKIYLYFHPESN
ncbi:MAG: excinuclease ABC subunit UvrC [Alphaproteobacteria bacterium]|nr:excinuclease ABC subunit UvrC [Alphaproteobacteria bacterium]